MKTIRIAIIGTGSMANVHVENFRSLRGCKLVAAVDLDLKRVRAFTEKHQIPAAFTDVKDLLRDVEFDAVSIVTPDASHAPLALQCLKAGKHVLCEKPLALNFPDARRMVAAAHKAKVINMVNFTYRNWPALHAIQKLVQDDDLGEIRHVDASYLQAWLVSKAWGDWRKEPNWLWRLSTKHGSKGVLGDVGVHILDFATFPVGAIKSIFCRLKAFPKAPKNRIGEYSLDANDSAVLNVEFANGALGSIHTTRWSGGHGNRLFLKISGTKGSVEFDSDHSVDQYKICTGKDIDKGLWKVKKARAVPTIFQQFVRSIQTGKQLQPDFARGAEIQKLLDLSFASDAKKQSVSVPKT
ncbi:MAG: Gfo/Idh/MocA family protein [Chthoniobacterales bacterium]